MDPTARHDVHAEAAVSRALITGDAEPAVETLRDLLCTQSPPGILPAVGRLGPLGAPLAREVAAVLHDPREHGRSQAADAYWRITGNPRPVLPFLLARAAPTTTYASNDTAWYDRRDALCVLAGMRTAGALTTTPPELRPLLELCATSASRHVEGRRGAAPSRPHPPRRADAIVKRSTTHAVVHHRRPSAFTPVPVCGPVRRRRRLSR